MVTKGEDGRWYKPCSECGIMQSYLRKNYAEESLRLNKTCKSCSNRKTENSSRGFYNDIRLSWFNKYKLSAELRDIDFDLTVEQVWDKYLEQNKLCALTNLKIGWEQIGSIHTASIDRVDSTKGYSFDNIQIVHKDINFMKQQFGQDYFIKLCTLVADKVKW